jgi:hypothetical protein
VSFRQASERLSRKQGNVNAVSGNIVSARRAQFTVAARLEGFGKWFAEHRHSNSASLHDALYKYTPQETGVRTTAWTARTPRSEGEETGECGSWYVDRVHFWSVTYSLINTTLGALLECTIDTRHVVYRYGSQYVPWFNTSSTRVRGVWGPMWEGIPTRYSRSPL